MARRARRRKLLPLRVLPPVPPAVVPVVLLLLVAMAVVALPVAVPSTVFQRAIMS